MKKIPFALSILSFALASSTHAFQIGQPFQVSTHLTNGNVGKTKQVTLLQVNLTPREQSKLLSYQPKPYQPIMAAHEKLPASVNLTMNHVPVLNQGMHGSCVTFASTAAIDAVLGQGDFVSQLCQLELGSYLENNGYLPSGWDGSMGPWVLDQMIRFGVISKSDQQSKSCEGVRDYPINDMFNQGTPMSVKDYRSMSQNIATKIYYIPYMNFIERFQSQFSNDEQADKVLTQVKQSLARGNRVTIGTFLELTQYCDIGACASYHQKADTWALTAELEHPPFGVGGHEMVIMGYDDNAVAMDAAGNKHKGLLILRNSWDSDVGDNGDYYMTYGYFKKFAGEVQEIRSTN